VLLCASVPPWGWWPLAFVGIAVLDQLIAGQPWKVRWRRTWLASAFWLYPSLLWMFDLTPPGYVIAAGGYAAYFATAMALCPPGRARWIALPGAFALAELARWSFPFGGVPLSTLAMSQADAPLAMTARIGGALVLVLLVVAVGVALSAAWERAWKPAASALAVVLLCVVAATFAPRGEAFDTIDVALVQGGGPQGTRADETDEREVFERHVAASRSIDEPVDLVLWPENVVNVEGRLEDNPEFGELQQLAQDLDAPLIVGIVEGFDDYFLNASLVFEPDGSVGDRYDKVRIVPFGEFVPMRGIIEAVAGESGIASRDARAGSGPGVLETDLGNFGTMISWEVFFQNRGQSSAAADAVLQLNPTNGSSYWLTQVQTQQVASSRLRAIESDRWLVQAAPTGFTAIVTPDGDVIDRTAISEQAVVQGQVELRRGDTIATRVGMWPAIGISIALMALAWFVQRHASRPSPIEP
jgi:apolipoprotein N-acyltransferase